MNLFKKKFFTKRFEKGFSLFTLHSSLKQINPLPSPPPRRGNRGFTLAEGAMHVAMSKNIRKCAFTLAEVLITLGIIGVVAALTLPTLIAKYQNQTYVAGLRKGLSVIDNIFNKMLADEGASSILDTELFSAIPQNYGASFDGVNEAIARIIPKYLNSFKSCKDSECDIEYTQMFDYFDLPGGSFGIRKSITTHTETIYEYSDNGTVQGFYSPDGMIYYFAPIYCGGCNYPFEIVIDTNGAKGPNILGRDAFSILYCAYYDNSPKRKVGIYHYPYVNLHSRIVLYLMRNGWKMDY